MAARRMEERHRQKHRALLVRIRLRQRLAAPQERARAGNLRREDRAGRSRDGSGARPSGGPSCRTCRRSRRRRPASSGTSGNCAFGQLHPVAWRADDILEAREAVAGRHLVGARDEDAPEIGKIVDERRDAGEPLRVDQRDLRAGILQAVGKLLAGPPGVERRGDRADENGSEKGHRPFRQDCASRWRRGRPSRRLRPATASPVASVARAKASKETRSSSSTMKMRSPNVRPVTKTSRSVGGAFFQTRKRWPRIVSSTISNGEPGAVSAAWACATDIFGQPGGSKGFSTSLMKRPYCKGADCIVPGPCTSVPLPLMLLSR